MIRETPTGVVIDVRVIPRAGRSGMAGERDGRLLVRLSAPPVEGAANDALVELLADTLDLPKRAVRIVAGQRSRAKQVEADGITAAEARRRLKV